MARQGKIETKTECSLDRVLFSQLSDNNTVICPPSPTVRHRRVPFLPLASSAALSSIIIDAKTAKEREQEIEISSLAKSLTLLFISREPSASLSLAPIEADYSKIISRVRALSLSFSLSFLLLLCFS